MVCSLQKSDSGFKDQISRAGWKEADIEEVSYAQCALLDEVALRTLKGNDREVWERNPMQVCFFQSYNAGDILCDRIESLCKNHKDASPLVAETYLSVINLGFRGRYVLDEDALHTAQEQLKKITPAFPSMPYRKTVSCLYRSKGNAAEKSIQPPSCLAACRKHCCGNGLHTLHLDIIWMVLVEQIQAL